MTHIHDAPEDFAAHALSGFCAAYPNHVAPVAHGAVRAAPAAEGKVALVVGGGSGHYPAFLGYVGTGLADAAVAGDVFASPSTAWVTGVGRVAHRGGGVILGFGNYAGDVLNFGAAAERLRAEGIDTCVLPVTDDVASAPVADRARRRGVAGDLAVFKITGAAAEAGLDLGTVMEVANRANAATVSFGVAFAGCTLPGKSEPLFHVEPGQMALGLGIHGEPGISQHDLMPAADLAALLLQPLLAERPEEHSGRVAVILNGLGATKYEELFVLWHHLAGLLADAGLSVVAPLVGEFVTSLGMAGCSLTLTWLDDDLEGYWCAPTDTPVLCRSNVTEVARVASPSPTSHGGLVIVPGSVASQQTGACIAGLIDNLAQSLAEAEDELGRIDAQAGDGDHGQGMARGSAAASIAAHEAVAAGAGAATVLSLAGDAWADRAGGTSGALWGVALRAWGQALSDRDRPDPAAIARGAQTALEAITRLGGAKVGDKTLVDALVPFVDTLMARVSAGDALVAAWTVAALEATTAARDTAQLVPKLGRARPLAERSVGHPDAGAISLALCARVIGESLSRLHLSDGKTMSPS